MKVYQNRVLWEDRSDNQLLGGLLHSDRDVSVRPRGLERSAGRSMPGDSVITGSVWERMEAATCRGFVVCGHRACGLYTLELGALTAEYN